MSRAKNMTALNFFVLQLSPLNVIFVAFARFELSAIEILPHGFKANPCRAIYNYRTL